MKNQQSCKIYKTTVQTGSHKNLTKAIVRIFICIMIEIWTVGAAFSTINTFEPFVFSLVIFVFVQVPVALLLWSATKHFALYNKRRTVKVYKFVESSKYIIHLGEIAALGYELLYLTHINPLDEDEMTTKFSIYIVKKGLDYESLFEFLDIHKILMSSREFKWDTETDIEVIEKFKNVMTYAEED